jgi:DNA-binding PadR family transcriptional regulator
MAALTPAVFHILLALAQGERHGYGVLKDVLAQTDGDVRLGPGTLYGTLQRLMESGVVEEVSGPVSDADHDERRRYYRITRAGRRALGADVDRMDHLVRSARAKDIVPRPSRG